MLHCTKMAAEKTNNDLMWAAGHIDGDGCYSIDGKATANRPVVAVGKAERGIASLNKLQRMFGGGIRVHSKPKGNSQQAYRWSTFGSEAISVCSQLKPHAVLKAGQCKFLAEFPPSIRRQAVPAEVTQIRLDIRAKLVEEKEKEHKEINKAPSPAWWAGFFDADGYIGIRNRLSLMVTITQKHRAVIDAAREEFGGRVCRQGNGWAWQAGGPAARNFLATIKPYAIEKLPQITAVFDTDGDYTKAHSVLCQLKGNQLVQQHEQVALVIGGLRARAGLHHASAKHIRHTKRVAARARTARQTSSIRGVICT